MSRLQPSDLYAVYSRDSDLYGRTVEDLSCILAGMSGWSEDTTRSAAALELLAYHYFASAVMARRLVQAGLMSADRAVDCLTTLATCESANRAARYVAVNSDLLDDRCVVHSIPLVQDLVSKGIIRSMFIYVSD